LIDYITMIIMRPQLLCLYSRGRKACLWDCT